MKKKLISITMMILLVLSLIPTTTFAASTDMTPYTPYQLTATLLPVDGTHPYGSVNLTFKINNLPRETDDQPYFVVVEKKIENGDWIGVSMVETSTYLDEYNLGNNTYQFEQLWVEDIEFANNISVSYRIQVLIDSTPYDSAYPSPWSNIASIGLKMSSWATEDVNRAIQYGLVPNSIKSDFTRPITREEFAELSVKLYEVYKNAESIVPSINPFNDCSNPEVLKAFKLEIVKGVSTTQFKPVDLTNREQIAAMLSRAVIAIEPSADMSVVGAPSFGDSKNIAPYFLENVKFMSKNDFIKGYNGNFDPKGTCTREMAVIIAVRVYEKYAGITQ